jgi:hypothetical protein
MFRPFTRSVCVILFFASFIHPGFAATNLLTNGSFEVPVIAGPWSRLNVIPGWTGSFDLHRDLPTADGDQLVDINQNSYGWIAQYFGTIPGAEYQLRFSHGVNYYCQPQANFAVEIDGRVIAQFDTKDPLQEKTLPFTASFPSTELRFTSLSPGCGATTIDNVVVTGGTGCGGDYSFTLPIKNPVNSTDEVDIAARVYRPCNGNGPYPLVVLMHGHHTRCEGPCNEGYGYLAEPLVSQGFVVVSINVKLPNSTGDSDLLRFTYPEDPSFTLMRGRLLLTHLERLIGWTDPGLSCQSNPDHCAPLSLAAEGDGLRGLIDWTRVGLIGHSRGGESVRAAYNMLNPAGSALAGMDADKYLYNWQAGVRPDIDAIFEIAPVDSTSDYFRVEANGIPWNVILPACDGDIGRLSGIMPFDRMLAARRADIPNTPKSAMLVWGANHSFFNSTIPAAEGNAECGGDGNTPLTAARQQTLGRIAVTEFFSAHLRDGVPAPLFNPLHRPDEWQQMSAITRIERSYSPTPHRDGHIVLHDFKNKAHIDGSSSTNPEFEAKDLGVLDTGTEHDPVQRALDVQWTPAVNGSPASSLSIVRGPMDLREFCTLDFRITRQPSNNLNVAPSTDFSLQLLYGTGKGAPAPGPRLLPLSNYLDLTGPAAGANADPHAVLQTVRIRLEDFGVADLSRVRGLRLVFNGSQTGAVYLADMRFERSCD